MPTPKKPGAKRGRPPKTTPEPESTGLTIRGLDADLVAGIERAQARRREMVGGFVSQNTTILSLLRAAIAAEDAKSASPSPEAR